MARLPDLQPSALRAVVCALGLSAGCTNAPDLPPCEGTCADIKLTTSTLGNIARITINEAVLPAGNHLTIDFSRGGGPIEMPAYATVDLGEHRGDLLVVASAYDTEGKLIGSGRGDYRIAPSERGSVSIDLSPSGIVPKVTSLLPAKGPTSGGTRVTISGENFIDGAEVTFDGVSATEVQVESSMTITATTPARPGKSGPVSVLVKNEDGTRTEQPKFSYAFSKIAFAGATRYLSGSAITGAVVTDLNGDQRGDVLASAAGKKLHILRARTDGTLETLSSHDTSSVALGVAAGDLNGDGMVDAVVSTVDSESVFIGMGGGAFQRPANYPITPYSFSVGTLADFNGDRLLDIAALSPGSVSVLLNSGGGRFGAARVFAIEGDAAPLSAGLTTVVSTPVGLTAGDFNGDGSADVVASIYRTGGNVVSLLGSGDGQLTALLPTRAAGKPEQLATGDLNHDGFLDVVAAIYARTDGSQDGIDVLLGRGDGTFSAPSRYHFGGSTFGVALGDIDGDGFLDLVAVSESTATVSVLVNEGAGTFGPIPNATLASGGTFPRSVAIGDIDADGRADLVIGNLGDSTGAASDKNLAVLLNRSE